MSRDIAILLPYKEKYTNKDAGAASIWVKDYLRISKLTGKTTIYGNLSKSENVKIRCKPTETKMQKKKLTLKWAIPESEIIDMPNLKQKRERRQKQK